MDGMKRPRIEIDRGRHRPLSRVLRPGAMVSGAGLPARERLLGLPGELGAVRGGFDWALIRSASPEAFLLQAHEIYESELRPFMERGALAVGLLAGTPRWLARQPIDETIMPGSGWPLYATRPPEDFSAYAEIAAALTRIDPRVVVEFWNEPSSTSFWGGTETELFDLAARCAAAIHGAGGQMVGMANSPAWDGLLERWIRTRPQIDGISWHCFQSGPADGVMGAEIVRGWLRGAGMDPNLPQIVTEWNRWTTFPAPLDPSRDTAVGMAHHMAALVALARSGVKAATAANLAGFGSSAVGDGDFGLLAVSTGGAVSEKPCWRVQEALAQLGPVELGAAVAPELAAAGVGILATDDGVEPWRRRLRAIVWRYDPDGSDAIKVAVEWPGDREEVELEPYDLKVIGV
jgi:hypothetical protein